MKKNKKPRWPDYDVIDLDKAAGQKVVTFGTTLFMRKDKQALRIVFPAGQTVTFCPEDEVEKEKKEPLNYPL